MIYVNNITESKISFYFTEILFYDRILYLHYISNLKIVS